MATYDSLIDRTDVGPLIPEETSREIIDGVIEQSVVMQLATRAPDMSSKTRRQPVLDTLPLAYFKTGDTGLKQTTEMKWKNRYLNVEDIAVLVPIPDNVIDDSEYPIWENVLPRVIEAIVSKFDKAILLGEDRPASWQQGLTTLAATTEHTLVAESLGDIYDDLFIENGLLNLLEADGYDASGHVAAIGLKARLRGLRDTAGNPIFNKSMTDPTGFELEGRPMLFPRGFFNGTSILDIAGDWRELVYAIRKDISWSIHKDGIISNAAGEVVFNAMQQDSKIMRVVFRSAWNLPNAINKANETNPTAATDADTPATYSAATRFMFSTYTSS